VLPTPALVDAFGGFLTSISAAYSAEKQKKDGMGKREIKAKLWPLTFIVNELLHTTKFHMRDRRQYDESIPTLRLPIINLVKDLSQFRRSAHPKQFKRVLALLGLWHKHDYFDKSYIESLKTLVESEGQQLPAEAKDLIAGKQKRTNGEAEAPRKRKKLDPSKGIQILGGIDNVGEDGEWKLPEWHGGENTPWHLLPAASWMKPLRITDHDRGQGMRKNDFRAINFGGDNVSKQVRKEVMKLLKQADEMYKPSSDTGKRIEYDQMGRKMEVVKIRKGADGKIKKYIKYETYYGWSPKFLDEMYKHPEKGFLAEIQRPISRTRSPSMSSSPPPKRRSPTPKRDRAPPVQPRFPPQHQAPAPAPPVQNYAPPPPPHGHNLPPPPPPQYAQQQGYGHAPPPPPPWMQGAQGQGQFPPPPPPNAPWSNAPPPPPPHMMGQNGFRPPVPPPPPPPPQQQGSNYRGNYNRGWGNNGYRGGRGGRGGYGRGGY